MASALMAAAVYAALWLGYRQHWPWLHAVDAASLRMLYDVGADHPSWVSFWTLFCDVFSPGTFRLLGMLAAVLMVRRRRWRAALLVAVSVEGSELVSQVAKQLAHRPRRLTAFVHESSSAFPSGHALASLVGVLALLTVPTPPVGRFCLAVATVLGAAVVAAVGFGRVALNVHHLTDVVAGWALGYLFFVLCRTISDAGAGRLRRRRISDPGPGSDGSRSAFPRSA